MTYAYLFISNDRNDKRYQNFTNDYILESSLPKIKKAISSYIKDYYITDDDSFKINKEFRSVIDAYTAEVYGWILKIPYGYSGKKLIH